MDWMDGMDAEAEGELGDPDTDFDGDRMKKMKRMFFVERRRVRRGTVA